MKQGIHPENYRPVVFKDMSNGDMFLSRSTCKTNDTIEFEGETYPVVKLEISSSSHPFYTGKSKLVDTAGRVDKFMNRYARTRKNNSLLRCAFTGVWIVNIFIKQKDMAHLFENERCAFFFFKT